MVMTNVSNEVCDWLHKNKEAMQALVEGTACVVHRKVSNFGIMHVPDGAETGVQLIPWNDLIEDIRLDHPTGKE